MRESHKPHRCYLGNKETPMGLAAPDHTVPYGTVLSEDAFSGTSCQATTGMSLRDVTPIVGQNIPNCP